MTASAPPFAFPSDTLDFLDELGSHNTRAWFEANRARYQAAYVEAAKAFIEAVTPILEAIIPGIHAEPRVLGSIFRINRDTRFSPDKRPYKDHLDLWFWEGDRKAALGTVRARLARAGRGRRRQPRLGQERAGLEPAAYRLGDSRPIVQKAHSRPLGWSVLSDIVRLVALRPYGVAKYCTCSCTETSTSCSCVLTNAARREALSPVAAACNEKSPALRPVGAARWSVTRCGEMGQPVTGLPRRRHRLSVGCGR